MLDRVNYITTVNIARGITMIMIIITMIMIIIMMTI